MISRLFPLVFLLAALGLFFGYINPTYSTTIAQIQTDLGGYDSALLAAKKYEQKKEELIAERNLIPQEGIQAIEAFLPDGVDNVQLILDLNSLASRSNLELSDFDISTRKPDENSQEFQLQSAQPVESLDLSMSAIGTYAAFLAFLEGTELSLRTLDLTEVSVQDSPTGIYTFQMTFRIYWLAPQ